MDRELMKNGIFFEIVNDPTGDYNGSGFKSGEVVELFSLPGDDDHNDSMSREFGPIRVKSFDPTSPVYAYPSYMRPAHLIPLTTPAKKLHKQFVVK